MTDLVEAACQGCGEDIYWPVGSPSPVCRDCAARPGGECEHGRLARKCETCQLITAERDLDRYEALLRRALEHLERGGHACWTDADEAMTRDIRRALEGK